VHVQRNNERRKKNASYQKTDVHKETIRHDVASLLQKRWKHIMCPPESCLNRNPNIQFIPVAYQNLPTRTY